MANPAYDIYEPQAGGFRARLASSLASSLVNGGIGPIGVSLNASGRLVKGTAGTGLVGILVKNVARGPVGSWGTSLQGTANPNAPIGVRAGDAVDVMTNGTIINLDPDDFPAGTAFYVKANGDLTDDANEATKEGNIPIGFTVDAGHLVVRFSFGTPAVPDLP